jgi:GH24 family phage-related lysozyme (muramidase)
MELMRKTLLSIIFFLTACIGMMAQQDRPENNTSGLPMYINCALSEIRKEEVLSTVRYKCPAGQVTIGYGHMIKKGEKFKKITAEQADSILMCDFSECFMYVDTNFKNLDPRRKVAMAHLIFCIGRGRFINSVYPNMIRRNYHTRLMKELATWTYYHYTIHNYNRTKDSVIYVKSNGILRRRLFEINMYNIKNNNYDCK